MRKSSEPKSIEAEIESSNSDEQAETEGSEVPQTDAPSQEPAANVEAAQSDDWWTASEQSADWGEAAPNDPPQDVIPSQESRKADVYFCGHTTFFPLNRALQAISREKLTGSLRSFWEQEAVDLLVRDGEIILVTTRDPELYCPETPAILADIDDGSTAYARDQQRETGIPFFLALARQELIARDPAVELIQQHGQRLFAQLWAAPRVWMMFEKNTERLAGVADVSGHSNVDDWALDTLRLAENVEESAHFDPTSIPAFTKEGFERVQKLQLTPDEAQFASQFNGVRSLQQIAKNLRLDLKSARQMLFRFVALEIVECWPASTTVTPEQKTIFQRFGRAARRDR